jgi:UDP-N-acetylmuramoyl-tripeptide--D-alanyl-D-alanine ligase
MIRLHDVLTGTTGVVRGDIPPQFLFSDVVIDSRRVTPGALFVAIPGETTDGHAFLAQARERGAAAALVRTDRLVEIGQSALPLIVVDNTLAALQALAAYWRALFDVRMIGITGSIGKSSTKEVVAAVAAARYRTFKSPGNYNSETGLPLSVLRITPDTEVVVLELGGAYAIGEIRQLSRIARQNIAVVTNVSYSHVARMGSLEAIAETKVEIVEALPDDGVAILNYDDERVRAMAARTAARVVFYGLDEAAEVRASDLESHGLRGIAFTLERHGKRDRVQLPLLGRHSVHSALVGFAVGYELGLSLDEMLRGMQAPDVQIRLVLQPGVNGSTLLDDTYNANPTSTQAALALIAELDATRRVAVLGDMLELGQYETWSHRLVGARVAEVADALYTVGPRARMIADEARRQRPSLAGAHVDNKDQLVDALRRELQSGDLVLIKGSRGVEMETVVSALRDDSRAGQGEE